MIKSEHKLFRKLNRESRDNVMQVVWGTDLPIYDPVTSHGGGGGGGGSGHSSSSSILECVCRAFILLFICPSVSYSVEEK